MVSLPLGDTDWTRSLSGEARIRVKNRYYEQNPTNQKEGWSLLTRPGLKRWKEVGTGPIRAQPYSQSGAFGNDLFVLSGNELYRISQSTNIATLLGGGFFTGYWLTTGDPGKICKLDLAKLEAFKSQGLPPPAPAAPAAPKP